MMICGIKFVGYALVGVNELSFWFRIRVRMKNWQVTKGKSSLTVDEKGMGHPIWNRI